MLIDDGLLTRNDGHWVPAGDLTQITVPPTIHALLSARLDRLGRDERAVIERGSVEGKVFHRGAVAQLSTDDLRESVWNHLQTLVRKELIRPDRTDLPGEDAFRFRHLLIRDAAYEAMPKELRAELHARFADWLEQIGAEHLAERDEIIGYHLEQAYRYRTELAPGRRRDARSSRSAAEKGSRQPPARRCADPMSPRRSGSPSVRSPCFRNSTSYEAGLLSELGYSYRERGDLDAAQEAFEKGLVAANETGDRAAAALIEARMAALATMRGGTMDEALADPALTAPKSSSGSATRRGSPRRSTSWACTSAGPMGTRTTCSSTEPGSRERSGISVSKRPASAGSAIDAFWYDALGRRRVGARLARSRPAEHGQRGQPVAASSAGTSSAWQAGRKKAWPISRKEPPGCWSSAVWSTRMPMAMTTACVSLLAGRYDEAERMIMPAYEALKAYGEAGYFSTVAAIAGLALAGQGRYDEAEPFVDEARAVGAEDDVSTQAYWRAGQGADPRRPRRARAGLPAPRGEPRRS